MKTSDIVISIGALGALGVVGWIGYNYVKSLGGGGNGGSPDPCAGIDTSRACNLATGITTCCGAAVASQTNPGQIDQKFTILPGGDITIAAPKDLTATPCQLGYYKTAAAAMDAFVKARGLQSISGTWRYEYLPDRPECFRIASVMTSAGEVK